jgi:hypothetical protein
MLWIAMDWVHNEIAIHSTFLDVVSVDEGSGKTLLLVLLSFLTRRPHLGTDYTSANIYRSADRNQPTQIIDEADEAFEDRQLRRIVNDSWTREAARVPRQVKVNGEWQDHWFNTFARRSSAAYSYRKAAATHNRPPVHPDKSLGEARRRSRQRIRVLR